MLVTFVSIDFVLLVLNVPFIHTVPDRDGIFSFSSHSNCEPEAFVECANVP